MTKKNSKVSKKIFNLLSKTLDKITNDIIADIALRYNINKKELEQSVKSNTEEKKIK